MTTRLYVETMLAAFLAVGLSVWGTQVTAPGVLSPPDAVLYDAVETDGLHGAPPSNESTEAGHAAVQRQLFVGEFEGFRLATLRTLPEPDLAPTNLETSTSVQNAEYGNDVSWHRSGEAHASAPPGIHGGQ